MAWYGRLWTSPPGRGAILPALLSVLLFLLAALAEIGGGWLVWQGLREHRGWPWVIAGGIVLILYGVIPTFQPVPYFGRVYAAYGGVFIVLSLAWGRLVDGWKPDRWDLLGAAVALLGVVLMLWSPRRV